MNQRKTSVRRGSLRWWLLCGALGFVALAAADAPAQTTLRWKLKMGETFHVAIAQQTSSQVAFSGKQALTKIELAVGLSWKVLAADQEVIRLEQTIDRVQVKLNAPQAGMVEYDSAAQAKLAGPAAEIAAAVGPLVGARIELSMNGRGEVQGTKPLGETAEALFDGAPGDQPGALSKRTIQQLLRQPLAVLPEKPVAKGDKWTTSADIVAAAGAFRQETTYTLADEIERDGQKLAKIESASKLAPAALDVPTKGKLALKSHQQTGTVLFAIDAGRLVEAQTKQDLVTERPYRETMIVVTLHSEQLTTVTPAKP